MSKNNAIRFSDVAMNATFSPAQGSPGSQYVYRKTGHNGVCQRLGAPVGSVDAEGIFYPFDRVVVINIGGRK